MESGPLGLNDIETEVAADSPATSSDTRDWGPTDHGIAGAAPAPSQLRLSVPLRKCRVNVEATEQRNSMPRRASPETNQAGTRRPLR